MRKLILLSTVFFATSCGTKEKQETKENQEIATEQEIAVEQKTLQEILDEKKANFELKASEEKKTIYAEGISSVENSGVLESALNVGDTAVNFTLKNALGEDVTLSDYLEKGPVVLTWYRGGWCPYCNLTLHRLQEELPNFKGEGANLLALSPEVPDQSMSTKEKHELEFEILSDLENNVGREYGIVYKLTDDVADAYQNSFDLHAYNGDESDELPLSATYVIDQNGVIQYAFLDAEYRNRAEPSEIINTLKELK
jgi:peroxiredoxin